MRRAVLVALAAVVLAAGCGQDGDTGVLTIAEALEHGGTDEITVQGQPLADANGTYLCSSLGESLPPLCGPPAVSLANLDLDEVDGVEHEGSVRWSDRAIRVTGRMIQGVLTLEGPPASVDGSGND